MTDSRIPALQRMNDVLGYIARSGPALPADIIKALSLPRSSIYLLVEEMKAMNFITQDPDGRCRLWMRLIELGEAASEGIDIRQVARRHLARLTEETGLLSHLGIIRGNSAYYVLKIESSATISVRSREGKTISLCRSGVGKCLLAWQPWAAREALVAGMAYRQATPNSIATPERLREEIRQIRERGWAVDDEEDVPNVRCVAAPVFDARNLIVAAISAVGATVQITPEAIPALSVQVCGCAQAISRELGWSAPLAGAS